MGSKAWFVALRLLLPILFAGAVVPVWAQTLTILCEESPPSQFRTDDGSLSGFAVELVKEIQNRTGNRDPIRLVKWSGAYEMALHNPNVVLFSVTRTLAREDLFHWIGPIRDAEQGLWALRSKGMRLANLDEARKLTWIGVYKDDVRDQFLSSRGFTNLDRSPTFESSLRKLLMDRIPAVASSRSTMESSLRDLGRSMEEVEMILPFLRAQVYIVMSLGTPVTTVENWNASLASIKSDGTFRTLFRRYYPGTPEPGPGRKPEN